MACRYRTCSTQHTQLGFAHLLSVNSPEGPVQAGTIPSVQMKKQTRKLSEVKQLVEPISKPRWILGSASLSPLHSFNSAL